MVRGRMIVGQNHTAGISGSPPSVTDSLQALYYLLARGDIMFPCYIAAIRLMDL